MSHKKDYDQLDEHIPDKLYTIRWMALIGSIIFVLLAGLGVGTVVRAIIDWLS